MKIDSTKRQPTKKYKLNKIIFKFRQLKVFQILTILVRYALGTAFVYASILKIRGVRFTPGSGENAPINSLPHLLESMYRSGFYWSFVGWGQLIAGFLMMSHFLSSLGAVVYFPIMLNIFILTTSFQSPMILAVSTLMLLGNVYLLLWDWNKVQFIVLPKPGHYMDQSTEFSKKRIWSYLGILLFLIIVVYRFLNTKAAS